MKRGEVWIAALDPAVGTEIRKPRPCVIVSPDDLNAILRRVIVAPLTSGSHPAPFRIAVDFRRKAGLILLDQIGTVDKRRLTNRLGAVDGTTLEAALTTLTKMFEA